MGIFIMLFTLFFIKNFVNSKYGRSCIAVRENEIAAEAMGVNTTKYKVMAFTIGAILLVLAVDYLLIVSILSIHLHLLLWHHLIS